MKKYRNTLQIGNIKRALHEVIHKYSSDRKYKKEFSMIIYSNGYLIDIYH